MLPRDKVMRIKKMITKEKMPRSFILFSQLILKGNVWRSVWRICMCTKSCLTLQLESPLKANTPPPPPHLFFLASTYSWTTQKSDSLHWELLSLRFLVCLSEWSYTWRRTRDVIWPCLTDTCLDKVWLTVSLRFWLSGTCDLLLF